MSAATGGVMKPTKQQAKRELEEQRASMNQL